MKTRSSFGTLAVLAILLASCARAPLKDRRDAMKSVSSPDLADDLPIETLISAVSTQLAQFENEFPARPGAPATLHFGPREISREDYVAGLHRFLELCHQYQKDPKALFAAIVQNFDFYEVYGMEKWGQVLVTSYYEPVIQGSLAPSARFTQPIYGVPADLVSIDLPAFDPKFASERHLRGRISGQKIEPYFTREEIDVKGSLKGRGLELCYVDPFDAFNLQVQGSGVVDFEDGKSLRLGYADKNGHRYESIGNHLKDVIPIEKMTMPAIEAYLRSVPREKMQEVLNKNPSYVFFKRIDENAPTFVGLSATAGRTIATDPQFFPKGTLAFLVTSRPNSDGGEAKIARFVLDQDIGGAIKGGGRVDLFWGKGTEAGAVAGVMKQDGALYYLLPKTQPPARK